MAYAEIAGVPPQHAFYAAPVALVAYAVFGSSRHLVVGATSAAANHVGGDRDRRGRDPEDAAVFSAALAIMASVDDAVSAYDAR